MMSSHGEKYYTEHNDIRQVVFTQETLRDKRVRVKVHERHGLGLCELLLQCCDGSLVS